MLWSLTERLARISSRRLLALLLLAPALPLAFLAGAWLQEARATDRARLADLGSRLIETLEAGGTPALRREITLFSRAQGFGLQSEAPSVALWRRGDMLAMAGPEAIQALRDVPVGTVSVSIPSLGRVHLVAPDLATISADWDFPMADLDLRLAAPSPGSAETRAWGLILAAVAFYLAFGLACLVFHLHGLVRYRDALAEINRRLHAFAEGETSIRLDLAPPAPELVELAGLVNPVLARIGRDIADLRDFSALAAHEMKTPIQIAQQEISRLCDNADDPDAAPHLRKIQTHLYGALAAFDAVLLLIRFLAERDQAPPDAPVDLADRLDWAIDTLGDRLDRAGQPPVLDIAPQVRVLGDEGQLDRLIFNLLENAAKYAPPDAEIRITLSRTADRFSLAVANTGGGFPADIRARAFTRFARARSAEPGAGHGLGLSLVEAIAARHGFIATITPSDDIAEIMIEGAIAPSIGGLPERDTQPIAAS